MQLAALTPSLVTITPPEREMRLLNLTAADPSSAVLVRKETGAL
jgi:hypothetical protein